MSDVRGSARRPVSGPGMVAGTAGVAWTATRVVLSGVWAGVRLGVRGVSAWAHLMAGRPGEDTACVLRRRKWAVLMGLSCPVVLLGLVVPVWAVRTLGVPLLSVSAVLAVVSIVRVRRLSRQAMSGVGVQAPVPGVVHEPVSADMELFVRAALADYVWGTAHAVDPGTAAAAVSAMPAMSQAIIGRTARTLLEQLGHEERGLLRSGDRMDARRAEGIPWLFDFTDRLGVSGVPSDTVSR